MARARTGNGTPAPAGAEPFWRTRTLEELTDAEWESLCDGCGRCCLNKLEDEDTGEISWTAVSCRLLDEATCRCGDYPNRSEHVPECVRLDPHEVRTLTWLPPTCAYRLVADGRDLYWWHPLVSGDAETVHQTGVSVRGRTVSETLVPIAEWERYLVAWPTEEGAIAPPGRRRG